MRDVPRGTGIRSIRHPGGLRDNRGRLHPDATTGNALARACADMFHRVLSLSGDASIENPRDSYIWPFLKLRPDFWFNPCCFGAPFLKPTGLKGGSWLPDLERHCRWNKAAG